MITERSQSSIPFFLDGASSYIFEGLKTNADQPELFQKQATVLLSLGRNKEALQNLNKAIDLNPNLEEPYFLRGNLYRSANEIKLAIQDYKQCIKLKTQNYQVYYNLGLLLAEIQEKEEALENFNLSLSLHESQEALLNKGILCLQTNQYDLALCVFNQAKTINPQCFNIRYNRGYTLSKLNKYEEALQEYNEALKLNFCSVNGYNNKAVVLCHLRRENEAVQSLKQGLKIIPDDPILIFNLFKLYRILNQIPESNILKEKLKERELMWREIENLEEIEKTIDTTFSEISFLQSTEQSEFLQQLEQYKEKVKNVYRNLWNYEIEFEGTQPYDQYHDTNSISGILQSTLNTDESIIKHKLLNLDDRVYFQSVYWRLYNYFAITETMQNEKDISQLIKIIEKQNSKNQPLLPKDSDKLIYESQLKSNSRIKTKSLYESQFQQNSKSNKSQLLNLTKPQKITRIGQRKTTKKKTQEQQLQLQHRTSISLVQLKKPSKIQSQLFQRGVQESKFSSQIVIKTQNYIPFQPIKISEQILQIINDSLGITSYNDQQLRNILKVVQNKTKTLQELDIELQIASYDMDQQKSDQKALHNYVQQIQNCEYELNKLEYINSKWWRQGIEDSVQVLFYFKEQYKKLLEPLSQGLRFQISASKSYIKSVTIKQNNLTSVEKVESSCVCSIF